MPQRTPPPTAAPVTPPSTSAAEKRAARQKAILNAAALCFARDGFHGTSMQKICAEAGMSPGALYRYFPSKEAIIAAIVQEERTERLNVFLAVREQPNIITGLVETLARLLREPNLPTTCLGPEIMAEAIRNTALRETLEVEEDNTRGLLHDTLTMAAERGEIDPGLALDDVVMLLQIMADGAVLHHQLHPEWNLPERLPDFARFVNRMFEPQAGTLEKTPKTAGEA